MRRGSRAVPRPQRGEGSCGRGVRRRRRAGAAWGAVAATLTVLAGDAEPALACAVCYGAAEGPMAAGMNNAILFLLGTVAVVQAGFVALFWTFWRRSRQLRERKSQFHVIAGGVHSRAH